MERPSALTLARRAVTTVAAAAALCAALAAPAAARWTRPVQVSTATSIDILGPQVASSATGAAAVSFNETNIDAQGTADAFVALATRHGAFGAAQAVPRVQEVLAVAYSGSTLELLVASNASGVPCCSTVKVIRHRPRSGFGPPQTIVTGVGGGATGRLVPLANGNMLAVIGGPQGLWATEARGAGRFGRVRDLTHLGSAPAALAVTGTTGGGSAVVWTQGAGRQVFGASAGPGATPARRRTLLTVPAAHAVDSLQIAPRPSGVTVAWSESSSDVAGGYHSRVMAADAAAFGSRLRGRALSAEGDVASAVTLAGDGNGAEVVAWNVCSPFSLACEVQSRVRPDGGAVPGKRRGKSRRVRARGRARWFGALSPLGSIDPGASPGVAMAPDRKAVIGWLRGGRVALGSLSRGGRRLGPARRGISGALAANLAVGIGPSGVGVVTWSEGTFATAVLASVSR